MGSRTAEVELLPTTRDLPPKDLGELSSKLVVIAALRILLISLSLGASLVLAGELVAESLWPFRLVIAAYFVSIGYALLLRYGVAVVALAYAQIPVDSLLASALIAMTGGLESVFIFAYVFVVIGGATTLYRTGAVLATLASIFALGTIGALQIIPGIDFVPRVPEERALLWFGSNAVALVLIAVLGSALAETALRTGRQLAKKASALERLEALHEAILRSLPAGLLIVDNAGRIRFANEAALVILGPGEPIVGAELSARLPKFGEHWRRLLDAGESSPRERYECTHARADGAKIRLGFSFAPLGGEEAMMAVFQDVTDIVRLKDAVQRAERLATIGQLAAGLAHEVRNPLASMCASIDVLKGSLDPPDAMRRLMDNVSREAERLDNLIGDFLRFARPRPIQPIHGDLSALVSSIVDVFQPEAEVRDLRVEKALTPGIALAFDGDALRQVLWNLLRNAAQAVPERGTIKVKLELVDGDPELSVTDDGQGIEPQVLPHIFDPFFTTKGSGSGLGLAIVHSLVEAHGGRVFVSSVPGQGTTFTVHLPARPRRAPGVSSELIDTAF